MPAEYGLFVSMLPGGKIKKALTGVSGERELGETTIRDEVILFSELSFGPYAMVVDRVLLLANYLLAEGKAQGQIHMSVFHEILNTVEDLVVTLEGENPMFGTLLRTAIEDHVPADDGTAMYPIEASKRIWDILVNIMHFQFDANELLHDLSEGTPIDFKEKYGNLRQLALQQILLYTDALGVCYHFRTAAEYYHFLLLRFVSSKPRVALCQCCGRYFIPKTKKETIYCDRILKNDKTCKHWGPILKHRLAAKDTVIGAFDQAKRRMYKRFERAMDTKLDASEKDLAFNEYYAWLDRAVAARDGYLKGELTVEAVLEVINVP